MAKGERQQDGEGVSAEAACERGAAGAMLARGALARGTEGEEGCRLVML